MTKPFSINYKICVPKDLREFLINIRIDEIEKKGLEKCLIQAGSIQSGDEFKVVSRNPDCNLYPIFEKMQRFRVYPRTIAALNDKQYPLFLDVDAFTKGKAIIVALRELGFEEFPKGWRDMKAEYHDRLNHQNANNNGNAVQQNKN